MTSVWNCSLICDCIKGSLTSSSETLVVSDDDKCFDWLLHENSFKELRVTVIAEFVSSFYMFLVHHRGLIWLGIGLRLWLWLGWIDMVGWWLGLWLRRTNVVSGKDRQAWIGQALPLALRWATSHSITTYHQLMLLEIFTVYWHPSATRNNDLTAAQRFL